MPGVGVAVPEDSASSLRGGFDRVVHETREDGSTEWHISRGKLLGTAQQIHALLKGSAAPHFAGSAKAGDDFVTHHQDVVPVADLSHGREVTGRRQDHTSGPLQGLREEGGDLVGSLCEDQLLELRCQASHEVRLRLAVFAVAIEGRAADVPHKVERKPHLRMDMREAGDGTTGNGDPMVAMDSPDNLSLLGQTSDGVVVPEQPDLRIIGIRAGHPEEDLAALQCVRSQAD
mmetsp:Transcript_16901/g.39830  ORF Transcript_16901/g.39830 Transcript_16901/m.39830 type:complete len:231 (-) Transcript_16901:378-1070(-)